MRKLLLIIVIFSFIFFSYGCSPKEKPAIIIGNIEVSVEEFESALARSEYKDFPANKENRRKFIDIYIDRKLILKEAVKEGLDKDSQFLESVQFFWEQSLLKFILNKKIKEFPSGITVDDWEINSFYETNKDRYPDKEKFEVYSEIKLLIFKEKQKEALDHWVDSLRKKTSLKINYELLNLE